jgi:hypothetical protein
MGGCMPRGGRTSPHGDGWAGLEYVVDERDGPLYFYDINALSNFVADAGNVIGFDPFERMVDWLKDELDAVHQGAKEPQAQRGRASGNGTDPGHDVERIWHHDVEL